MKKHGVKIGFTVIIGQIIAWAGLRETTIMNIQDHLNMITANSVFAGFLFSGLSIMISLVDVPRIKRLNDHGYLDKYFFGIYAAIVLHILSVFASLLFIVFSRNRIVEIVSNKLSIGFLISGLILFSKTIFRLIRITHKARFE